MSLPGFEAGGEHSHGGSFHSVLRREFSLNREPVHLVPSEYPTRFRCARDRTAPVGTIADARGDRGKLSRRHGFWGAEAVQMGNGSYSWRCEKVRLASPLHRQKKSCRETKKKKKGEKKKGGGNTALTKGSPEN